MMSCPDLLDCGSAMTTRSDKQDSACSMELDIARLHSVAE